MNFTAGIRELCFTLLFSAVHCGSLSLMMNSCRVVDSLEPQTDLLIPFVNYEKFTPKILDLMKQTLNIEGIPKLDDMDLRDKTGCLEQFYKAFQGFTIYFSTLEIVVLENYLKFHQKQMDTITNELKAALGTKVPIVSTPSTEIKSNFDKKQFSYKVLKLYVMWLDALKKHFCQ